MSREVSTLFRVRFQEKTQEPVIEALVKHVEPSHLPGMICLTDFIFRDATKRIILPEEDAASKRFRQTRQLHLPYHAIHFIEEFEDSPTDVRQLPFLREVQDSDET